MGSQKNNPPFITNWVLNIILRKKKLTGRENTSTSMCTLLKTLDKFVKSKYNSAMENLEESTKEINGAKNAVKKVITVVKVNDEK